ncbi:MAG: HesA/MoeB/ThiF family protein [Candidatus Omnitrophica bacterium]|nr:HesA/MoeB/ThiF family protein [Candidatus Omnitrophota bacterium]
MELNKNQLERYKRHIMLLNIGIRGQEKILNGKVLIIGMGGLGSSVGLYLASAGVGTIGIADYDNVEISNLQRQIIHFTSDIGKKKVLSAKEKIEQLNPDVKVVMYAEKVKADNIAEMVKGFDFIVDATDNFAAKFLINDACVLGGKPFSHGGVVGFDGQTMTYLPGTTCYRCIFKAPPVEVVSPENTAPGVVGTIPGMLGTIQATEAIKYILGIGELLTDRFFIYESLRMKFRTIETRKNSNCPICAEGATIKKLFDE